MDKSWITMPRNSPAYDQGVRNFIEFAFQHSSVNDLILCPCPKCGFRKHKTRAEVYDHLICKPFPKGYTIWYLHGELHPQETNYVSSSVQVASQTNVAAEDPIRDMVNDAFGVHEHQLEEGNEGVRQIDEPSPNVNQTMNTTDEFCELSNDAQQPLYEGCANYSKVSFILKLYHIKCLCGMSDKAMTMILELLHDAFPNIKIPSSFYDAKKTITKLGLSYDKIHACPNNCMLYWGNKEDEEREICRVCNVSRWKEKKDGGSRGRKKIPAKRNLAGAFVNEEARRNHENLVIRSQSSSENDAYSSVFGKDHPEYVRGMGLGVVPTQVYGPSSSGTRHYGGMVSATAHNALKDDFQRLTRQFEAMQQQVDFLMRERQNVTPNQENVGSPDVGRPSSHGSYSAHVEENSNRTT